MDSRQERRLLAEGVHIVVGTPGRLRDHIERGGLDLSALKVVVLDEADEMLCPNELRILSLFWHPILRCQPLIF
jgi:superfamily II DNA/RNA helicase